VKRSTRFVAAGCCALVSILSGCNCTEAPGEGEGEGGREGEGEGGEGEGEGGRATDLPPSVRPSCASTSTSLLSLLSLAALLRRRRR